MGRTGVEGAPTAPTPGRRCHGQRVALIKSLMNFLKRILLENPTVEQTRTREFENTFRIKDKVGFIFSFAEVRGSIFKIVKTLIFLIGIPFIQFNVTLGCKCFKYIKFL